MLEFLATLKARPDDPDSPALHARENDLWTFDLRDIITPAPYSGSPYAIVEDLPRTMDIPYDGYGGSMAGAIDVSILQPQQPVDSDTGEPASGAAIALVMAHVLTARRHVNELSDGYPLQGRLSLVDETGIYPRNAGRFTGKIATARFSYRIKR